MQIGFIKTAKSIYAKKNPKQNFKHLCFIDGFVWLYHFCFVLFILSHLYYKDGKEVNFSLLVAISVLISRA